MYEYHKYRLPIILKAFKKLSMKRKINDKINQHIVKLESHRLAKKAMRAFIFIIFFTTQKSI